MTKITTYECDNCGKVFKRPSIIEFGARHYCKECARILIADMLKAMPEQLSQLTFDDVEGRRTLEYVYEKIMEAYTEIDGRRVKE